MNSTKYIFDLFNSKRNNKNERNVDCSLVQYDAKSAKIFLQMHAQEFNKNCDKSKYLPIKMNQQKIECKFAENKENISNKTPSQKVSTPLRNTTLDDISSSAINWNNFKENKDKNSLCNLLCKLPKVTSASAISPERHTHICHGQTVYDGVPKEDLEKESILTINNSNPIPKKDPSCQVKSINSYRYPILSFPDTYKELLSSVVSPSEENNPLLPSSTFKNKDRDIIDKSSKFKSSEKLMVHLLASPNKKCSKFTKSKRKSIYNSKKAVGLYQLIKLGYNNHHHLTDFLWKRELNKSIRRQVVFPNRGDIVHSGASLNEIKTIIKKKYKHNTSKNKRHTPKSINSFNCKRPYIPSSEKAKIRSVPEPSQNFFRSSSLDFYLPSLTTKSFIGNKKVQSYFQSHSEIKNIDSIVKELQKDFESPKYTTNPAKVTAPNRLNKNDTKSKCLKENVNWCCRYYGIECDCILCNRKKSQRCKG